MKRRFFHKSRRSRRGFFVRAVEFHSTMPTLGETSPTDRQMLAYLSFKTKRLKRIDDDCAYLVRLLADDDLALGKAEFVIRRKDKSRRDFKDFDVIARDSSSLEEVARISYRLDKAVDCLDFILACSSLISWP